MAANRWGVSHTAGDAVFAAQDGSVLETPGAAIIRVAYALEWRG
ncbi:MAG: hypothetical protein ACRDQ2_10410 [Gaiellales bacterium]